MNILDELARDCDASKVTVIESILGVWKAIALNLNEVLKFGGSIDSLTHDLGWLYAVITFPVLHYSENLGTKGDIAIEFLRELLEQVHISSRNMSLESNEICKRISSKLVAFVEEHPDKLLGVANAMKQIVCSSTNVANKSHEVEELNCIVDLLCKVSDLLKASQRDPKMCLSVATYVCNSVWAIARGWPDTDGLFLRLVPVVKTLFDFRAKRDASYEKLFLTLCRQLWNTYLVKRHNQPSLTPEVRQAVGDLVIMVKELMTKRDNSDGYTEYPDVEVLDDFENAPGMMYYIMPVLSDESYLTPRRRILATRNNANGQMVPGNGVRRITPKLVSPRNLYREVDHPSRLPAYAAPPRESTTPEVVLIEPTKKVDDDDDVVCLSAPVVKNGPPDTASFAILDLSKVVTDTNLPAPRVEPIIPTSAPVENTSMHENVKDVTAHVMEQSTVTNGHSNFHPRPLTKHQKEMMRKRRDNIPALYGDLTQDTQSNTQFGESSSTQETVTIPERFKGFNGAVVEKASFDHTQDSNVAQEPFKPSTTVSEIDLTRPFSGIFQGSPPSSVQARDKVEKTSIFNSAKQEKMSSIQLKRVHPLFVINKKSPINTKQDQGKLNVVLSRSTPMVQEKKKAEEAPDVALGNCSARLSAAAVDPLESFESTNIDSVVENCSSGSPVHESCTAPSKTSVRESCTPSRMTVLGSCTIPSKTTVIEKFSTPSRTTVLESCATPSRTTVLESCATPRTIVLENCALPSRTTVQESCATPNGTTVPDSCAMPNRTTVPNSCAMPSTTTVLDSCATPSETTLPESCAMPSGTTVLESCATPSRMTVLESCAMPSGTTVLESCATPSGMTVLESCATPSGTTVLESCATPSGTTVLESCVTPSRMTVLESCVTPSTVPVFESSTPLNTVVVTESISAASKLPDVENFSITTLKSSNLKHTPRILKKGAQNEPNLPTAHGTDSVLYYRRHTCKKKQSIMAPLSARKEKSKGPLSMGKNITNSRFVMLKSNPSELRILAPKVIKDPDTPNHIFTDNSSFFSKEVPLCTKLKDKESSAIQADVNGDLKNMFLIPSDHIEVVSTQVVCLDDKVINGDLEASTPISRVHHNDTITKVANSHKDENFVVPANHVSDSQDFVDSSQESIRSVKISLEKLPDIPPGGNALIAREVFVSRGPEEGSPIRIHKHSPVSNLQPFLTRRALNLDSNSKSDADSGRRSSTRTNLKRQFADLLHTDSQCVSPKKSHATTSETLAVQKPAVTSCSSTARCPIQTASVVKSQSSELCINVSQSEEKTGNLTSLNNTDKLMEVTRLSNIVLPNAPPDLFAQIVDVQKQDVNDTSMNITPDNSPCMQHVDPPKLSIKKRKIDSTNDNITPVKLAKTTDVRVNPLTNNVSKLKPKSMECIASLPSAKDLESTCSEESNKMALVTQAQLSVPTCDNILEPNKVSGTCIDVQLSSNEDVETQIEVNQDLPDARLVSLSEFNGNISNADSRNSKESSLKMDVNNDGFVDNGTQVASSDTASKNPLSECRGLQTSNVDKDLTLHTENLAKPTARQRRELKNLKIDFAPAALQIPTVRRRKLDNGDFLEGSDNESLDSVDSQARISTRRSKIKPDSECTVNDNGRRSSTASRTSDKFTQKTRTSENKKINAPKLRCTRLSVEPTKQADTPRRRSANISKENLPAELNTSAVKKQLDMDALKSHPSQSNGTTLSKVPDVETGKKETDTVRKRSMLKSCLLGTLDRPITSHHKQPATPQTSCTNLRLESDIKSHKKKTDTPLKCDKIIASEIDTTSHDKQSNAPQKSDTNLGSESDTTFDNEQLDTPKTTKRLPSEFDMTSHNKHLDSMQKSCVNLSTTEGDTTSHDKQPDTLVTSSASVLAATLPKGPECPNSATTQEVASRSTLSTSESIEDNDSLVVPDSQPATSSKTSAADEDTLDYTLTPPSSRSCESVNIQHPTPSTSRAITHVHLLSESKGSYKYRGKRDSRSLNIMRIGNEKIEQRKLKEANRVDNEAAEEIKLDPDVACAGMTIDYENCLETTTDSNGVNVTRPWVKGVWSPCLQPERPILKAVSPCISEEKRRKSLKRVNFPDEFVVTKELVYIKSKKSSLGSPLEIVARLKGSGLKVKSKACVASQRTMSVKVAVKTEVTESSVDPVGESQDTEMQTQETQEFVSPVPLALPRPELLNERDPFFPALIECEKPVNDVTQFMVTPTWRNNLNLTLKDDLIETVGDFCRLTEKQIFRLPLKEPKIETARRTLKKFYKCLLEAERLAREREHILPSDLELAMADKSPKEVADALQNLPSCNDHLNYIFERMSRAQKLQGIDHMYLIKHLLRLCDATEIFDALAIECNKKGTSFMDAVIQYVAKSNDTIKELVASGIKEIRSEDFVSILVDSGILDTIDTNSKHKIGQVMSYVLRKQDCRDVLTELKKSGKLNNEATNFIVENVDPEEILAQLGDLGKLCGVDTSLLCKRLAQPGVLSHVVNEHKTEDICDKLPLQELLAYVSRKASSSDLLRHQKDAGKYQDSVKLIVQSEEPENVLNLLKDSGNIEATTKFTVKNENPETLLNQLKNAGNFEACSKFVVENEKPENLLHQLRNSGNFGACTKFTVENEKPENILHQLKDSGNFEECTKFIVQNEKAENILNHLKDSKNLISCTKFVFDNEQTDILLNQLNNSGKLEESTKFIVANAKSENVLSLISKNLSNNPIDNADAINELLTSYSNKFGLKKYYELCSQHLDKSIKHILTKSDSGLQG